MFGQSSSKTSIIKISQDFFASLISFEKHLKLEKTFCTSKSGNNILTKQFISQATAKKIIMFRHICDDL